MVFPEYYWVRQSIPARLWCALLFSFWLYFNARQVGDKESNPEEKPLPLPAALREVSCPRPRMRAPGILFMPSI